MDKKKVKSILGGLLVLVIFFIGFASGASLPKKLISAVQTGIENNQRDNSNKSFSFINPLLDCGDLNNLSSRTVNDTKEKIVDFIDEQKAQGIDDVAVYFRDLNNGPWFGIKEKEDFLPASLLKVPLMMNIFKQAMSDPSFLSKQFVWQGRSENKEHFKAESELENNHAYSIGEAVDSMIRYSDNNSSHILTYALDTSTLLASYTELGIASPNTSGYAISARTYASFFRILYNSTFLNKEYSEKALRLLSETQFNKGLVSGVPATIKISHKFGERQVSASVKQLHDCGIVYYPNKPYLLCVMTRGRNLDELASFIGQVSKIVYESVDQSGGATREIKRLPK